MGSSNLDQLDRCKLRQLNWADWLKRNVVNIRRYTLHLCKNRFYLSITYRHQSNPTVMRTPNLKICISTSFHSSPQRTQSSTHSLSPKKPKASYIPNSIFQRSISNRAGNMTTPFALPCVCLTISPPPRVIGWRRGVEGNRIPEFGMYVIWG